MKDKYVKEFKDKSQEELLEIIKNPSQYNSYEVDAAHELLRKKTATFSEYQELTGVKSADDENGNIFLTVLKWIGIILFFPLSLVVVGYYKNKKAKKEYYANNRPQHER
ncbi:hypothetical protein U8527_10195 [Kordia algicida OT-1]|uniref:Uncharacterized protein n=1 Tax=Kordia algicida OT-1 TaxID=391587 RepID=A9DVW4_9FLAO|nr:hypothetical protein [Kordia algicida]EDP96475.1 hypothetical protein KAOT1_03662 [Kordia algicida OT-1]